MIKASQRVPERKKKQKNPILMKISGECSDLDFDLVRITFRSGRFPGNPPLCFTLLELRQKMRGNYHWAKLEFSCSTEYPGFSVML